MRFSNQTEIIYFMRYRRRELEKVIRPCCKCNLHIPEIYVEVSSGDKEYEPSDIFNTETFCITCKKCNFKICKSYRIPFNDYDANNIVCDLISEWNKVNKLTDDRKENI